MVLFRKTIGGVSHEKTHYFYPPPPEKSHYYEIFQIIHGKSKKIACATFLAICLTLTSCSQAPNASDITQQDNSMTEQESPQKYITQMDFSNDDEFWEFAESNYSIVTIDEISSGNKKGETVLVDALLLDCKEENATTFKYTVAYKSADGSYLSYEERITPSFCKLMTSKNILSTLKQGDTIRICALVQHSTDIDFNVMYGLKVTGNDDNAVKSALNLSDNPLLNLSMQTEIVMNGNGDESLGERAYLRMDKKDIENVTQEQYSEFEETKVKDNGYLYFSIIFTDGTGIQWTGSDPGSAVYGKMDLEGRVTEPEGYIQIIEGEYSYFPSTSN